MKQIPIRGRKTEFSRELKPEPALTVASNTENFEPEVPTEMTLSEKDRDGEPSQCGLILRYGKKRSVWANAEQLLGLARQHSAELAEAFYQNGKVLCNVAIGVVNGRFVVQPAV